MGVPLVRIPSKLTPLKSAAGSASARGTDQGSAGRSRALRDGAGLSGTNRGPRNKSGPAGRTRAPQDEPGHCRTNQGPAGLTRAPLDEPRGKTPQGKSGVNSERYRSEKVLLVST